MFPLQQLTLEKMTTPGQPATGTALRGLGWDIDRTSAIAVESFIPDRVSLS